MIVTFTFVASICLVSPHCLSLVLHSKEQTLSLTKQNWIIKTCMCEYCRCDHFTRKDTDLEVVINRIYYHRPSTAVNNLCSFHAFVLPLKEHTKCCVIRLEREMYLYMDDGLLVRCSRTMSKHIHVDYSMCKWLFIQHFAINFILYCFCDLICVSASHEHIHICTRFRYCNISWLRAFWMFYMMQSS